MKNLLLIFIFVSCSAAVNAQEIATISNNSTTEENVSTNKTLSKESSSLISNPENTIMDINKVCYGETSKVAFYEVLIAKNGFKINLKDSKDLVIRNTEEIISKKIEEILYSEED
ncbi:hypothetical protein D1818_11235 [Aquimarina sp. BL5]|uniref:hypothetical protein n=1 Tax=Aquimarina sp. BL5 TaxID=1714860 RepID=UPI000E503C01|nr:hypothetical protein [Aquimarina sp. BL5]AXT51375.1 hypothetical protein D1818_11235 [Aquimarina sp. BL5]RKN05465.1 hypothetical protein D7036_10485 [Aquimarina sp. BL5]